MRFHKRNRRRIATVAQIEKALEDYTGIFAVYTNGKDDVERLGTILHGPTRSIIIDVEDQEWIDECEDHGLYVDSIEPVHEAMRNLGKAHRGVIVSQEVTHDEA